MDIRNKIRGKGFRAWGMLLVCLLTLVFPQAAYAAPNDVTLAVEQVFTRPADSQASDTFTYTLTALQSGNPMPVGSSGDTYDFTISGTDTVNLGSITCGTAGTYRYELRQTVTPAQTGYTYDGQVYTVEVYATSTASGLRADAVVYNENGGKVSAIAFANSYQPLASDPSLMVDPPVRKTVSGSPSVDGTFTFKLEAENKSNPMPTGSKDGVKLMTIVGPGEEDFGTWSYTKAGTYKYTISEVDNKETGYTYDTAVYTITDNVKDVDGQLTVTRTVTNASNKQADTCDFINQYASPTGTKGTKTGDGSTTGLYQAMLGISGFLFLAGVVYRILAGKKKKEIKSMS